MTLIEIMVVLVILGLIASAVVIAVFPQLQKARVDRTDARHREPRFALKLYNARQGKFPDTATGFKALVDMEIIDKMPKDAWGNDYVYMLENGRPIITSYGADGVPGGDGPNADITNRPRRPPRSRERGPYPVMSRRARQRLHPDRADGGAGRRGCCCSRRWSWASGRSPARGPARRWASSARRGALALRHRGAHREHLPAGASAPEGRLGRVLLPRRVRQRSRSPPRWTATRSCATRTKAARGLAKKAPRRREPGRRASGRPRTHGPTATAAAPPSSTSSTGRRTGWSRPSPSPPSPPRRSSRAR